MNLSREVPGIVLVSRFLHKYFTAVDDVSEADMSQEFVVFSSELVTGHTARRFSRFLVKRSRRKFP